MKLSVNYLTKFTTGNVCILLTFVAVSIAKSDWNIEECFQIGFNRANLLCSSCAQLPRFGLDILYQHCLSCCQTASGKNVNKKYPAAVLEMCECKMSHYPQIQAFIKSDKSEQFPGLTMKHISLADPVIKLIDSSGEVDQELSIGKWDTDALEEFLRAHMEEVNQL